MSGDIEECKCSFDKEMTNDVLKKLGENREIVREMITSFTDTARKKIEATEKSVTSSLDKRHRDATKKISRGIEQLQRQEVNLNDEMRTLRKYFVSYEIKDNSCFVFSSLKKCFEECVGCSSVESFLASIPQVELKDFLKTTKEFILYNSIKTIHQLPLFIINK